MHVSHALLVAAVLGAASALAACSGSPVQASAEDAEPPPATDAAPAPDDAATDARADAFCLLVDDAGVTHGCAAGGQGPGDHDDGGGLAPPPPDASPDATGLPFGSSCWDNAQCASGICFDYRVKGTFCTLTCSTNADCPPVSPTLQLGCNGQGVCRM
jgi:hypothetical protein